MSAFMDALQSCTGLSGPYSCSNGPPRSSSLWAEKAGRPSGRPVVEGECAQSWTRRAFNHMTGAIKEHRSRCSVSSSPSRTQPPPPHSPHLKQKRGLIVCCESQRLESLPSLFLPCLFLLSCEPPAPLIKNAILSKRQEKKNLGILEKKTQICGASRTILEKVETLVLFNILL